VFRNTNRSHRIRLGHASLVAFLLVVSACSGRPRFVVTGDASDATGDRRTDGAGGGGGAPPSDAPLEAQIALPDAQVSSCMPVGERAHALQENMQVSSVADVVYSSEPPSSGPNCGVPGIYGAYSEAQPLDRCYWINNLARGGIVLLYNCPGGCPDVVQELAASVLAARDPDCANTKRIVITPDPTLPTQVAAVAWGYTWTSSCLDQATTPALLTFINSRIGSHGQAPERQTNACP
jgi:hypothetical protein